MKGNAIWKTYALLFACVACNAQGSGSTAPEPSAGGPVFDRPFAVTRSVQGKLTAIDREQRLISVEDQKGKRLVFRLDERTRFKADKKTELAGRKKLDLADLNEGDPVRVIFNPEQEKVLEVRLIYVKPPKTIPA